MAQSLNLAPLRKVLANYMRSFCKCCLTQVCLYARVFPFSPHPSPPPVSAVSFTLFSLSSRLLSPPRLSHLRLFYIFYLPSLPMSSGWGGPEIGSVWNMKRSYVRKLSWVRRRRTRKHTLAHIPELLRLKCERLQGGKPSAKLIHSCLIKMCMCTWNRD